MFLTILEDDLQNNQDLGSAYNANTTLKTALRETV